VVCIVIVDPKQPSQSLCSLSAGFDFTGYAGDTRQVRDPAIFHWTVPGEIPHPLNVKSLLK